MLRKSFQISACWRLLCLGSLLPFALSSLATAAVQESLVTAALRAAPMSAPPPVLVKSSRKKSRKSTSGPTLIQDIRVTTYPEYTRLVFDLQRQITFTQRRQKAPRSVTIELQNAVLGKTAKSRLSHPDLPAEVVIAQANHSQAHSVIISLDLDALSDYKLLPLAKPHRLVIDVYGKIPVDESVAVAPVEPPVVASASPSMAVKPRVAREINTIVIDAGHGGKDPGAIGRGGTAEKDITLKAALLLRDRISKELGKQVLLTRDRDVFVELEERAAFANKQGADLFVSIHVNSHPQRSTKGFEVYHFGEASDPRALAVAARENGVPTENMNGGLEYILADLLTTKKMSDSLDLAWLTKEGLMAQLTSHYDVVDHGVKTGPFYVLRFTAMPSILAEIAFISNPSEERLMRGQGFLNHVVEGIFEGIKAFIGPAQVAQDRERGVEG